jgi:hypothetical protein
MSIIRRNVDSLAAEVVDTVVEVEDMEEEPEEELVDTGSVMVERLLSLKKPQTPQKLPRMPKLELPLRPPSKRKRLLQLRPSRLPNRPRP